MVTIFVSKNDKNAKKLIGKILSKKDYTESEVLNKQNVYRIISKDKITDLKSLQEIIIDLEYSFFKENKGELYKIVIESIEKPLIKNVLEYSEGNQLKAARILGINRNTIRSKIKKYNINSELCK